MSGHPDGFPAMLPEKLFGGSAVQKYRRDRKMPVNQPEDGVGFYVFNAVVAGAFARTRTDDVPERDVVFFQKGDLLFII